MMKSQTAEDIAKNVTLIGNDRFEGYVVDFCQILSRIVNFTYEFSLVKDNKFGDKGMHFQ